MKQIILFLVLLLALSSCDPINPPSVGNAYPGNGGSYPIAPHVPSSRMSRSIPTPLTTKGTISGQLVSATPQESIAGLVIYAATILPLTPGPDHMINVDLANSPKDLVREDGQFAINNVEPGEYVLMLWAPHSSSFVPDAQNPDAQLTIRVWAGQIVDIGTRAVPPPQ